MSLALEQVGLLLSLTCLIKPIRDYKTLKESTLRYTTKTEINLTRIYRLIKGSAHCSSYLAKPKNITPFEELEYPHQKEHCWVFISSAPLSIIPQYQEEVLLNTNK